MPSPDGGFLIFRLDFHGLDEVVHMSVEARPETFFSSSMLPDEQKNEAIHSQFAALEI
jgi:hypothetical protein